MLLGEARNAEETESEIEFMEGPPPLVETSDDLDLKRDLTVVYDNPGQFAPNGLCDMITMRVVANLLKCLGRNNIAYVDDRVILSILNGVDRPMVTKQKLLAVLNGCTSAIVPCWVNGNHFTLLLFVERSVNGRPKHEVVYIDSVKSNPTP
jgi:hypothetical protein